MIAEYAADIKGPQMRRLNVFGDFSPNATVNYTFLTWKLLNLFLVPREEPIYILDTTLKPYCEYSNFITVKNSTRHTVIKPKGEKCLDIHDCPGEN